MSEIAIHYTRPPDRTTVFRQQLVHRSPECIVTLLDLSDIRKPMVIRDVTVLEPGSPIVWFTFPGLWHDIGRFHTADGTFTGFYANILTPVTGTEGSEWETTDLFLDVWCDDQGTFLLDEDELDVAASECAISSDLVARAYNEGRRLLDAARTGTWPPPTCHEWTLERARRTVSSGTPARPPV